MLETTERHRRCCRVQCCVRGGRGKWPCVGPASALRVPKQEEFEHNGPALSPGATVTAVTAPRLPERRGLHGGAGPSRVCRIRAVMPPFAGHLSAGRGAAAAAEQLGGVQHTYQTRMNSVFKKSIGPVTGVTPPSTPSEHVRSSVSSLL
jgi:hypothetical protein